MTDLNAAEKRANAARVNAYQDLGKLLAQCMAPSLGLAKIEGLGPNGTGSVIVHATPEGLSEMVAALQQRIEQMDIAVDTLVKMLTEVPAPVEGAPATDFVDAPPLAAIDKAAYWERCAKTAEMKAAGFRRAVMSQGVAGSRLIRPS